MKRSKRSVKSWFILYDNMSCVYILVYLCVCACLCVCVCVCDCVCVRIHLDMYLLYRFIQYPKCFEKIAQFIPNKVSCIINYNNM